MSQLLFIQLIFTLLFFSSLSYSQYNALSHNFGLYEQECNSPRKEFSKRVLDTGLNYCTEDQNPYLKGCQLIKPPVFEEPSFDGCIPTDNKRSSDTLYLGTSPYIYESCFFASTLLGAHMWDGREDEINESKDTTQKPPSYYWCENSSSSNPQKMGKEARSCIDKNYITGTTKAFNEMAECFDFNDEKDKKRLFVKFHVESRLLLRKVEDRPDRGKKPSTNRCFGQLKNSVIETLNQYIYFGDDERQKNYNEKKEPYLSTWFKYGDIYKSALTKCPFLSNLLTPNPSTLKDTSLRKPSPQADSTFKKKHKEEASSIICKTSQDPYSCLFYSMYNARRNLLDITEQLEKLKQSENYEISFYIDDVPLFKNEDDLKWSFVIWAHNGGSGIIKNTFPDFIDNLKKRITSKLNMCKRTCGCQSPKNHNDKCAKRCLDKCKFKSLRTSDLHREFSIFIKDSEDIVNPEEVSDFMNKIKTQIPALSSKREIRSALERFHKGMAYDEEMNKLIDSTQQHCPTNINQIFDYN